MKTSVVGGNQMCAVWARFSAQGELEVFAEVSDQQMRQRFYGYDGTSERPFVVAPAPDGVWKRHYLDYVDSVADGDRRVGLRDRYAVKLDGKLVDAPAALGGVAFGMEAKVGGELQEFYLQQFNRNPKPAPAGAAQPWDNEPLPASQTGWWKVLDGYRSWKFDNADLARKALFLLRQGSPGANAIPSPAPDPQFRGMANPQGPLYL